MRSGRDSTLQLLPGRENKSALKRVLKLTRVPWPGILKEELHYLRRNALHLKV